MSLARPERTFADVPYAATLQVGAVDVVVLGAAHGTPYRPGVPSHAAAAPAALRRALGWYAVGTSQFDFDAMAPVFGGARIVDVGDVATDVDDAAANRAAITAAVSSVLEVGAVSLVFGGDDSVPIPVLAAFAGSALTVVQVDAHIDWRDEVDGERLGFSSTMRRASEMPHVRAMVQVGARGTGSARERELVDARAYGATIIAAREVHRRGISVVLDEVPHGQPVYLAVDVDGLDPSLVPGVLSPEFGGLDYTQMVELIHGLEARAPLVGASFVEYVPEKDPTGLGALAVARLVSNVVTAVGVQRRRA